MGLFDTTQLALEQALSGATLRQRAIANNIANANTPGFKRSDVDFHATLAKALASGDPSAVAQTSFSATVDNSTSTRADGNNVDIDQEMGSLSENSLEYQSLVTVARSRITMLQIAMGSRTS